MAKVRAVRRPASLPVGADPTIPFVEIPLRGKVFKLCFNTRSLIEGEIKLREQGIDCAILRELPNLGYLSTVATLFACACARYHPELTHDEAVDLIDIGSAYIVAGVIQGVWASVMPKAESQNPPKPVA